MWSWIFRTPAVNLSSKRCLEMRSRLECGILLLHYLVTNSFAIADVKCIAPMIFGNIINPKTQLFWKLFFRQRITSLLVDAFYSTVVYKQVLVVYILGCPPSQ